MRRAAPRDGAAVEDAGEEAAGAAGPELGAAWAPRRARVRPKLVRGADGHLVLRNVPEEEAMVYSVSSSTVSVPAQRLTVPPELCFQGERQTSEGFIQELRSLSDFAGRAAVMGGDACLLYVLQRFEADERAREAAGGNLYDPFRVQLDHVRACRLPPAAAPLSPPGRGGPRQGTQPHPGTAVGRPGASRSCGLSPTVLHQR